MYTLKEGAEACGKGKTALLKAIQKGRISASKNAFGEWEIDPAELHRVYPPVPREVVNSSVKENESERQAAVSSAVELAVMTEKIAFLESQLEREREFSQELSRRLDDEAAERRKLTALLTHQPKPAPMSEQGKGRLWEKLFGGSKV